MDPSNFPNPQQFPKPEKCRRRYFGRGGGDARWPGHKDYRVETPGSVGSTFVSEYEFDLFFNTDAYRVEEVEPSCWQPSALKATRRKKRMARKENAPAVPLPSSNPNNEYVVDKYMKAVEFWVDISEDSIYANNQTLARMWDRIEARYNEMKTSWVYKRNKKQLSKCWDQIKLHINNFRNIYTKLRGGRVSGESMEDDIQKAMVE